MKNYRILLLALCLLPQSADAASDFRKMHRAWLEEGQVIHPASVRQVMTGMTKDQVYRILGAPHFNEGIGAKSWNYIFQLRANEQSLASNCQYHLHYDHGRIDRISWQDPACERAAR